MIPYFVLFGVLAFGSFGRSDGARLLFWVIAVILTLFIGLRFEVGTDWGAYSILYSHVRYVTFGEAIAEGDIGFYAVSWGAQQLGLGIWSVNLVCASLFTAGLARLASRQPNYWLALVAGFPIMCVILAMGATRQSAAAGIIMLALCSFSDRRTVKAMLYIALATLFHASAVIFFPLLALSFTRNKFQSALVIAVGILLASSALAPQLDTYAARYTGDDPQAQGALIRLLLNALPSVLFLRNINRFALPAAERVLWRNIAIVCVACVPVLILTPSSTSLDRLSLYLTVIQIVVFSRIPYVFSADRAQAYALVLLIVALEFTIMLAFFLFSAYAEFWAPYSFYPFS